jgi:hypothetical protein
MGVGVQLREWSSEQLREWSSEQFRIKIAPDVAIAFASLLRPAALTALVFGLWRLTADMSWTQQFPIASGLFSHWQVWLALGAVLQMTATTLSRGRRARKR